MPAGLTGRLPTELVLKLKECASLCAAAGIRAATSRPPLSPGRRETERPSGAGGARCGCAMHWQQNRLQPGTRAGAAGREEPKSQSALRP